MHFNDTDHYEFSASGNDEEENVFRQEIKIEEISTNIETLILQKIHPLIIGTFGTIGNLLIITYFIKINLKKLKKMSAYHFIIIQLAVTDFLTCFWESLLSYYWSKQS